MPTFRIASVCLLGLLTAGTAMAQNQAQVSSPNGAITLTLVPANTPDGDLRYTVDFHGKRLIDDSKLGLEM